MDRKVRHTDTNLLLDGNYITNNSYFFGNCIGGGVFVEMGKAKLYNNVITSNYSHYGGGIAITDTIVVGETYPSILINNTISSSAAVKT